jgi:hypothetical protein
LGEQWKYRSAFETRLPAAFTHFGDLYASFKAQAGRLSAETFKGQITTVLDILELWCVFPSLLIAFALGLLSSSSFVHAWTKADQLRISVSAFPSTTLIGLLQDRL